MRELQFGSVYGVELDYYPETFSYTFNPNPLFVLCIYIYRHSYILQKQTVINAKNGTNPFKHIPGQPIGIKLLFPLIKL